MVSAFFFSSFLLSTNGFEACLCIFLLLHYSSTKPSICLNAISPLQLKQITLLPSRPLCVETPSRRSRTHCLCLQSGTAAKWFIHFHRGCSTAGEMTFSFILQTCSSNVKNRNLSFWTFWSLKLKSKFKLPFIFCNLNVFLKTFQNFHLCV